MSDSFYIALRESLQASFLVALVLFAPPARDDARSRRNALLGLVIGFLAGTAAGAIPAITRTLGTHETWTFWRHGAETVLFYGSVALLAGTGSRSRALPPALFLPLGFSLVFFEARTLGFIAHDLGAMTGRIGTSFAWGAAGLAAGALPLLLIRSRVRRLPFERTFSPASLLMSLGALQLWMGGLGELGGESVMVPLQRGLQLFFNEFMKSVQSALLITEHPFLEVTLSGLAEYLGSDRSALTVTVLFLMIPPVYILVTIFARPDPQVTGIAGSAHRRQAVAGFRRDLTLESAPVLTAFIVLVVMLHAVNVSMNPLYDPEPVPVREADEGGVIKIPLSGKSGDLTDKKLRKFVYYEGTKQVLFIAIMKADNTVGVALDQCEICRPADWNKDAKGYAQKGENLICKYCVTPIATNTVNTPGGCNPIPVPFKITDGSIVLNKNLLVSTFDKAEALEKGGTHL
ncbi:MAG: DUF2318 domain-containing protein [Nitrospirota bacterium]|nr:DUF2318 domain-containing protein [Nitrospirota bacterium]